MKVYRINKWAFRGICLLILLLPVSRHWRLLTSGERTTGTVTQFTLRVREDIVSERDLERASEIEFDVDGEVHKTYGPPNYEYKTGRSVTVLYMKKDPSQNCIATFSGFYLSYYTVIPIVLITFWYAFYLSFNMSRKRMKKPGGTTRDRNKRIRIS